MAIKKVAKVGIKKEKGFLYFVDKQGDISSAKMARGDKKGGAPKKVAKVGIKREVGYLYFIDKTGRYFLRQNGPRRNQEEKDRKEVF